MTEYLAADAAGVARAAGLLRAGKLVAFGTETVYGLGADATNAEAVAGIFAAKNRPRFNPLICHYPDADAAFAHVEPNAAARRLAAALWPGPLTLVLPRRAGCPVALLTGAGLDTLAVRVPRAPTALALLQAVGRAVAAPSANRSGRVSPTNVSHVLAELDGRIDAVVDGGPCTVGVESTVLDLSKAQPLLLRPGGTTIEEMSDLIGPIEQKPGPTAGGGNLPMRSPGMLGSHYAPVRPVRLGVRKVRSDEALLAFGPALPGAVVCFNLSEGGDLVEAAARLFLGLRRVDGEAQRLGLRQIAVMPVPEVGLGMAINDRLRRAAAPRDDPAG